MLPKIDTVLYCTELGSNSAYVFRYAYAIAKQFGGKVAVLHVVETLSARQKALVEGYSGLGSVSEIIRQAEEEAARRLPKRIEEFCDRETPDDNWRDVVSQIFVAEGHVTDQILKHVESTGADMVVVGGHGESSLLESIMGSTARRLVKECPVPVLTVQVPEGKQDLTMIDV